MTRCDANSVAVEGPACDPRLRYAGGGQASLDFFGDGCGPGQRVLDVGCGRGDHLRSLLARGCEAIGVERDEQAVEDLQEAGLNVIAARAEQLPFPNATFDVVICSVVVPFTDERRAVAEWARVLRTGGQVRASFHGLAYYLQQMVLGPGARVRLYGARAIANSWLYRLSGNRLPGFWGDTLYQSIGRLRSYYRRYKLRLEREYIRPGWFGLRDIFFHRLERTD